jgi:hypothetical protein
MSTRAVAIREKPMRPNGHASGIEQERAKSNSVRSRANRRAVPITFGTVPKAGNFALGCAGFMRKSEVPKKTPLSVGHKRKTRGKKGKRFVLLNAVLGKDFSDFGNFGPLASRPEPF